MIHASLQAVADPKQSTVDVRPLADDRGCANAVPRAEDLRAEALWETAPWLAGLSLLCASVVAWTVCGTAGPLASGGWLTAVLCINWLSLRLRRLVVNYPLGRVGRSSGWSIAGAAVHAGLWSILPVAAFAAQPVAGQILLAVATATMVAGAFLIALAPVAAATWGVVLAAALLWGARGIAGANVPVLMLLALAYLAVILGGCFAVERLVSRHLHLAACERSRRDAIALLLKEYEDWGAAWLWQIDAFGLFTYVSPRIAALVGRAPGQMLGLPIGAVFRSPRLSRMMAAREAFAGLELQVNTAEGPRWVSISGSPIVGPGGRFHGFRGVGADVTETHRSQERLTRLACNDMLTGLPNRQSMRDLLADAIEAAERDQRAAAVLFLDLDGFKPVNDRFGHPVGDAVLRGVAQRLAATVGDRGRVGRLGGDEFALVLHDGSDARAVEALARTLIATVGAPFAFDQGEVRVGLSVGCAFAPADGTSVEEVLHKADMALYEAKSRGRGMFCRFRPEMQRAADRRAGLEHDLRQALRQGQLSLHYQPVLSAGSYEIQGFEALLRWHHPVRGQIGPAAFLPIAEEAGIIGDIGAWVLHTACRDAAAWPAPLFVSVNVSDRQLATRGFAGAVSDALGSSGLPAERLHLEIPERAFLGVAGEAIEVLRRVRRSGVRLALDNFGIGHAALGHVATNLFDTLKIDGRFLREALSAEDTAVMVHAIVAVAESFRMHVVAERIEQRAELAQVEAIGCGCFQGFLAAAPMSFADTKALLRTGAAPFAMAG
jgi:diguanylate cyclase (GGDEF)-like protein